MEEKMPWDTPTPAADQENTTSTPIVKDTAPDGVQCPRCYLSFKNDQALRMHHIRVHTPAGRAAGRGRAKSEQDRLATRREYQHKLRERYYREGKNSRGEQMPPGWKPRSRQKPVAYKTSEAERDYARKWYQKNKIKNLSEGMKASWRKRKADNNTITTNSTGTGTIATDLTGEAAKAIMVAANVIRAVATGLKITQ